MKRFLSFILALTLAVSLVPSAFAASDEAVQAANALYTLGLFNGTGTDTNGNPIYDLDRAPTREEAITMLIRLMGKESDAKGYNWEMPFTDVSGWAKPYVGAAYSWGLTSGTSETTFGGKQKVSAMQYLTFVLRALDYEDGTDFQWDKAWKLSDEIGVTSGQYTSDRSITRGELAIISAKAVSAPMKNYGILLDEMLNEGVITPKMIKASGLDIIPDFNYQSIRFRYIKDQEKFYRLCDGTWWTYTKDDEDYDAYDDAYNNRKNNWLDLDGDMKVYFDKYTNEPYLTVDAFAALNTLFSGDYTRMIRASDSKTSQFASGVVWLTQRNIGCAYRVQRKEVSLNNYKSDVSVAYKSKDLKYSLTEADSNSSIDWTERSKIERALNTSIYQQTGVKCKVEMNYLPYQHQLDNEGIVYGYQPAFNVHGLLDYFGITDPVIRDKFENIQVKNIDGTDVLIVN